MPRWCSGSRCTRNTAASSGSTAWTSSCPIPFDLAPIRREVAVERPLLVMPSPRGGVPMRMRRWLPFGAPVPAARLFEDSEHFAGVRDYEPGDPMHHVHWRLSAHAGAPPDQDVRAHALGGGAVRARPLRRRAVLGAGRRRRCAEETIGMASYLARQAIHAGWRAGVVANTHLRRGRGPLRVSAAASAGQESVLFTALARMPNQPTDDLAPILREVGRRLTRRTTVVVLSPTPGPSLIHEMERLRRRGSDVIHVVPAGAWEDDREQPHDAVAHGAGRRRRNAALGRPWRPRFRPRSPRPPCSASPCTPMVTAGAGATIPVCVVPPVVPRVVRRRRRAGDPLPIVEGRADRGRRSHRRRACCSPAAVCSGRSSSSWSSCSSASGPWAGVPRLARADRRLVPDRRPRPRARIRRRCGGAAGLGSAADRADARVLRWIVGEPGGLRVDDRTTPMSSGRTSAIGGSGAR